MPISDRTTGTTAASMTETEQPAVGAERARTDDDRPATADRTPPEAVDADVFGRDSFPASDPPSSWWGGTGDPGPMSEGL